MKVQPKRKQKEVKKERTAMRIKTLNIEGMSCGHCTMAVERALNKVEGVINVKASLDEKNAVVETDGSVSDEALANAVTEEGFTVKGVK